MLSPLSDGNVHGRHSPTPKLMHYDLFHLCASTGFQHTTFTIFLSGHSFNRSVLLLQTLGVNWQHVIVGLLVVITKTCGFSSWCVQSEPNAKIYLHFFFTWFVFIFSSQTGLYMYIT